MPMQRKQSEDTMNSFIRKFDFGAGTGLAACVLPFLLALAGCGSGDDGAGSSAAAKPILFHAAEMVKAPQVLTGDPSDGRCADTTAPCFKDNKDMLNGQRRMLVVDDIGIAAVTHNSGELTDFFVGGYVASANSVLSNPIASGLHGSAPTSTVSPPAVVGARMFLVDKDVMVSAAAGATLSLAVNANFALGSIPDGQGVPAGTALSQLSAAKARFANADGSSDGVERVVFGITAYSFSTGVLKATSTLQVLSAKTPGDPSQGFTFGAALTVDPIIAMATGDFFGNGPVIVTATEPTDGTLVLHYFTVDAKTLVIAPLAAALTLQRPAGGSQIVDVSLAAGHFKDVRYEQLLIAAADVNRVDLLSVDTMNGTPVQRLQTISLPQGNSRGVLRAGRFDWSSPFDSVAYMLSDTLRHHTPGTPRLVLMLTLDANLDVASQSANVDLIDGQCIYDMQAGNFDRRDPDPTPNAPAGATIHNPNLQLGFVVSTATNDDGTCSGGDSGDSSKGLELVIWNVLVGASGFQLQSGVSNFGWSSFTEATLSNVSMAAVDLQGRSLVLGAPRVLVQPSDQQVDLVLAAPPMHADFIGAGGNLLNLSVAPKGFTAGFQFTSSSDQNSTSTNSTSSTFSTEETIDAKLTYGVCGGTNPACGSIEDKAALKQANDSSTAGLAGTFSSQSTSLSAGTVFHDQVLWSDRGLTFYVYPVLGRTQCPSSKPDCQDSERVPLTAIFAGPDTVQRKLSDGGSMNWYQPPWMPGNLLSYPGNRSQLAQAAYPQLPGALQSLSADTVGWSTDEGSGTQQTQWRSGATAGSTVSHSGSFSYNNTTSLGVQVTPPLGLGFSLNVSVNESGSSAWSNLSDSKQTLSQSSGVTFTKGAQFARPTQYQYGVQPIIFGQLTPPSATDAAASNAGNDLSTWGALRTAYIVDPLGDTEGSMWRSGSSTNPYRAAPDVAFNHPDRWTHKALQNDLGDGTCLFVSSANLHECVSLTGSGPADPVSDDYHRMRGFFITGAEGNGSGAQLASATAGDKLLLQARVHNFSLQEMPANSSVRVRFYAMVMNTSTNSPVSGTSSFFIGEATAPAVPPFSTSNGAPNWVLVSQVFDTTGHGDTSLLFWAITWIDDGTGNMVVELSGKGLKSMPSPAGPGTTVQYTDIALLDEAYGNNIGIYQEVFQIRQKPTASAAAVVPKPATVPSIAITEVGADATSVVNGERVLVAARLRVGENTLADGMAVHFVDGHPEQGGKLVAARRLHHLRAGTTHEFRAAFRSGECGSHQLYAVAGPGTRFEHIAKLPAINVTCP
jgi:hypothetical protein